MFIKPNTKAFIHVFHFLFTILDAKEFKSRFYWPIYDRNSENIFRTSTVAYMNHLIDKYELKMAKWKAYNVVLPGGLKFMAFLLKLINLVTREVINRKSTANKSNEPLKFTKADATAAIGQHKEWCDTAVKVKEAIQGEQAEISNKIASIDSLMSELFKGTDILSTDKLSDFLDEWKRQNQDKLLHFRELTLRVKAIDADFDRLVATTDKKMVPRKMNVNCDEDKFAADLEVIRQYHPEMGTVLDNVLVNKRFNITKLISILDLGLTEFSRSLDSFVAPSTSVVNYELRELANLSTAAEQMKLELLELANKLEFVQFTVISDDSGEEAAAQCLDPKKLEVTSNSLKFRLMSTPPVVFNFGPSALATGQPSRFALQDHEIPQLNRTKLFLKPSKLEPSAANSSLETSSSRRAGTNLLDKLYRASCKATPDSSTTQYSQREIQASAKLFQMRPALSSTMLSGSPDVSDNVTITNNKRPSFGSISTISSPSPGVPDATTFAGGAHFHQNFKKNIFAQQVFETTTKTTTMHTMAVTPERQTLFGAFASTTETSHRNSLIHLQGRPQTPQEENYFKALQRSPTGRLEPLVSVVHANIPRVVFNADSFNSDATDESSGGGSKDGTMVSVCPS
jgi:HAUS augmin-like complex subunit 6